MHYQWDFFFLLRYAPLFWKGVLVTLGYTAGTILLVTLPSKSTTGKAAPRWMGAGVVDASDKGAQVGVRGSF